MKGIKLAKQSHNQMQRRVMIQLFVLFVHTRERENCSLKWLEMELEYEKQEKQKKKF